MDREMLAWAAGLFEGEGTIVANKHVPRLTLVMTDFDIVDRFAAVMGIGILTTPARRGTYKPTRKWEACSFETAQHAMCQMWEWLGERRKQRYAELASAYLTGARTGQNRWGIPIQQTRAWVMFGKRYKDLTSDELSSYRRLGREVAV